MLLRRQVAESDQVDYHSDFDHVSRSDLVIFATSRRRYKRKRDAKKADDDNDALRIGRGTHAISLRDAIELGKIKLIPESALSATGKRQGNGYREFCRQNRGKTLLLPAQYELCQRISDALHQVEIAETPEGDDITVADLVENPEAKREVEYRWDEILPCRLKADLVLDCGPYVICLDLKTARSVHRRRFFDEIRDRKLWLQVAHYKAGLERKYKKPVRFIFVAVEKSDPHEAEMFELDEQATALAMSRRLELLKQLKECQETGIFEDPKRGKKINKVFLSAEDMGIMADPS
jgi:hypothetical protein